MRSYQRGRAVPGLGGWLVTMAVASVVATGLTATAALAKAGVTRSQSVPAVLAGHPYRHGYVPRRGHSGHATAATPSSGGNLTFGGGTDGVGVATGAPKVYLVFWGSQWGTQGTDAHGDVTLSGDPDGMAPYLQAFLKGLGTDGETWSGVMTQYCQGVSAGTETCPITNLQHVGYPTGGALAGVWVDGSTASPASATGHELAKEAINAAAHFGDYSSSSQYVVVSPTGTDPDSYEQDGYCAWHDFTGDSQLGGGAVSSPPGDPPVAFTNLPYIPDAGSDCGQNFVNSGSAGALDGVSIVEGHEYAETITDTFPPSPAGQGGWTDSSGSETGDKCAWISSGQGAAQNITVATGSFAVQSTWANDFNNGAGGCEISHPVTVSNPGTQTTIVGSPISSLQISSIDNGSSCTSCTYSASGLPAGVTLSPSGQFSGTAPHGAGSSSVTVTAKDTSNNNTGSTTFTWNWVAGPATTITVSPPSAILPVGGSQLLTVSGTDQYGNSADVSSTHWSASGGSLSSSSGKSTTFLASSPGSFVVTATLGGANATASVSVPAPTPNPTPPTSQTPSPSQAPSSSEASKCPAPTGALSGKTLGLVRLGMTHAQVRAAYAGSSRSSSGYQDEFCLAGSGVRVGYASPKLLAGLTAKQRKQLAGRAVWAITADRYYTSSGLRAGTARARAKRTLSRAQLIRIGGVSWYFFTGSSDTVVVKVQGGVVQEIGIANKLLTQSAAADRLLAQILP